MVERPRILWLHTQPEHYFNCMMDDLQRAGEFDYVAAFASRGPQLYKDYPQPKLIESIFFREKPGVTHEVGFFQKSNIDWQADLGGAKFDLAIISGYGRPTTREAIFEFKRRGVPVVMWSDSNIRSQRGRGLKQRLKRAIKKRYLAKIIRSTNRVMTTNSLGLAYWRYYGCPNNKLVLCPYYSDYARVEAAAGEPRADVFARFNLELSDKLLFSSARLVPVKGLDLAIKAFVAGGFARSGWKYLIAGSGPLKDELAALAGADAGKSVRLIGFQEPRDNLALMAHADLFLLPSRYEPHGIVIAESAAAGTPMLTSDVCGASADLVLRGHTGELFRSEDVADLQDKLRSLLGDPARLRAMRPHTREHFERWFAATSPVKVVNRVVREVLGEKAGVA